MSLFSGLGGLAGSDAAGFSCPGPLFLPSAATFVAEVASVELGARGGPRFGGLRRCVSLDLVRHIAASGF